MTTTPALLQVEEIPVEQIEPSPTNPRKHYDQAALDELAASIKSVGVQVPLSLRVSHLHTRDCYDDPGGAHGPVSIVCGNVACYEIVGGERRWRAAQIAGLSSVPAIVRVMTDDECREAQLVDNLQRADLSPMEEAECYGQLNDPPVFLPLEILAAKVGKTVQYVTQRLRLLQLIPEARGALHQGVLNLSLALLIARLEPANQGKAALYAVDPKRFMQGDLRTKIVSAKKHLADDDAWWHPATESQMREWIAGHTLLPLKPAAWDLADAALLPEAGACTACSKRSGNASMLFGDLAADEDTCTDPECYRRKEKAFVKIQLKADPQAIRLLDSESQLPVKVGATTLKQGQWIIAKAKSCPAVTAGITENGKRLQVCPDQKCKVHKHQVQQPVKRGEVVDWEARQKEQEKREAEYVAAESPIRIAVFAAIRPKLTGAMLLRFLANYLAGSHGRAGMVAKLRGIKHAQWQAEKPVRDAIAKAKDADIEGWVAELIAAEGIDVNAHMSASDSDRKRDRAELWALGQHVGLDCDAIAKKLAPAPVKKAEPAKAAAEKPAKKKERGEPPVRKKKLSAEGRKRIADAMRKRWAASKKKAVRK